MITQFVASDCLHSSQSNNGLLSLQWTLDSPEWRSVMATLDPPWVEVLQHIYTLFILDKSCMAFLSDGRSRCHGSRLAAVFFLVVAKRFGRLLSDYV